MSRINLFKSSLKEFFFDLKVFFLDLNVRMVATIAVLWAQMNYLGISVTIA